MKIMQIEDIILKYSNRGMDQLRPYLEADFCSKAAKKIVELQKCAAQEQRKVILTTGFYVKGFAETDGPLGTYVLGRVLERTGIEPVIVTDRYCRGFFESTGWDIYYMPLKDDIDDQNRGGIVEADQKTSANMLFLEKINPIAMIAIERCGENIYGDYANMRGISIRENTAPVDKLFETAMQKNIFTIGIGDGGNEIGMGNVQKVTSEKLSLVPCRICTDQLIIATVSNWGAYGLAASLQMYHKSNKLMPSWEEVRTFLEYIVDMGCVDGVLGDARCSVDGFDPEIEQEIYQRCVQWTEIIAF